MCGWYGRTPHCFQCDSRLLPRLLLYMRLYQAVSSRRICCLRLVARRRARILLPHRRAVRFSSMVLRVSSLIHWCFFLRRGPSTAWLVSFRAFLPSFQRFSMDEADSSDSDRSANRLCSFSTKLYGRVQQLLYGNR